MNTDLDDPQVLSLDRDGMFGWIAELGTQLIRAWHDSEEMEVPQRAPSATSVIIAGMGGSATGGDYFAALCAPVSEIPVTVVRGYSLPNYVSERTLVIVSSYSGNTEESLSCYDDAWKRGAAIAVLTTGGKLAERAAGDSVPVHTITYHAHPRAALAHSLAPLLRIGTMTGICPFDDDRVQLAGELHRSFVTAHLVPPVPLSMNGAKQVAEAIHGRVAFVLGAEHLAPAAARFKNQLAENGKALGAADTLPEADHNLLVGLGTGSAAAKSVSLVTLESPRYNPRTRKRFDVTTGLFEAAGIPVHRLEIAGNSPLQDLLLATAWGYYVSCYLALLNGQDPGPVPQIDLLKAALAG